MKAKTRLVLNRDLVIFDLETTGLNTRTDKIVQIAAAKYGRYKSKDKTCSGGWMLHDPEILNLKINPEMHISAGASDVHGIFDSDISECPTFETVAKQVHTFFKGCDLGGYNIKRFDIHLLLRQLKECGIILDLFNIIDSFEIFKEFVPHTLSGAFENYCHKPMENAHDALADVIATGNVLWSQFFYHREIFGHTAKEVSDRYIDPAQLDLQGQLKRKDKKVVLTFGKYKDIHVTEVPKSYFRWCVQKDILNQDALDILRDIFKNAKTDVN